jgi:LysR family transcriptional activator of nhaA
LLFDVGVADALSKRLVSGILDAAVQEGEPIHFAVLNPPMKCCSNS